MQFSRPQKSRRTLVSSGIVGVALIVAFLISGFFPWSPLNCWHDDVDINTGRVRRTQYLLFFRIGDRTEDTWVSRSHDPSNVSPAWRRVNTFSPGVRRSPHYSFHGAIHQIKELERTDAMIQFGPNARLNVAKTLIRLWQKGNSYMDADRYVYEVSEIAFELYKNGESKLTLTDIPAN